MVRAGALSSRAGRGPDGPILATREVLLEAILLSVGKSKVQGRQGPRVKEPVLQPTQHGKHQSGQPGKAGRVQVRLVGQAEMLRQLPQGFIFQIFGKVLEHIAHGHCFAATAADEADETFLVARQFGRVGLEGTILQTTGTETDSKTCMNLLIYLQVLRRAKSAYRVEADDLLHRAAEQLVLGRADLQGCHAVAEYQARQPTYKQ